MGCPTPCLQVERFQVEAKRETEDVEVPQGSGERLRDIPNVAFKMGKLTGALGRSASGWGNACWAQDGSARQGQQGCVLAGGTPASTFTQGRWAQHSCQQSCRSSCERCWSSWISCHTLHPQTFFFIF